MTTTIFKKNKKLACIASDSRVTLVDKESNLPIRWFDDQEFLKTLTIDDVMYGFAGCNAMFKIFLAHYTCKEDSEILLDTLVELAHKNQVQFFIIRYDGQLKLFAYSPPNPSTTENSEIFRVSTDPVIDKSTYAIGSGKFSKEFKRNQTNPSAQVPIRKIISANQLGLRKAGMLDLARNLTSGDITLDDSRQAYLACFNKGGDLFTGGEVRMTQNATREMIQKQVAILERMDQQAKAVGAVCASPVNAGLEIKQLASIGQYAISPEKGKLSVNHSALFKDMQEALNASI